MNGNNVENGFLIACEWLSEKWRSGYLCMSLWAYFIVCIIVFGCMGIWFQLAFKSSLSIAILSSSYAITGTASADFIFLEQQNYIRSIPIYVCVLIVIFSVIFYIANCSWIKYLAAIVSLSIASAMWFLGNAGKIKDVDPLNSSGGDVHKQLPGKTDDTRL